DLAASEADGTLVGGEKAVDDIEQRGLAGAVRPDDAVDHPLRNAQRHLVDRLEAAEGARHAVKLEDRWAGDGSRIGIASATRDAGRFGQSGCGSRANVR